MFRCIAFAVILPTSVIADAPSECHAILADGKVNKTTSMSQEQYRSASTEFFCSSSFQNIDTDKGASLAGVYEDITGNADYSQESHSTLSNEICSAADRSNYSNARSVLLRQIVDKNTVDAWRSCITSKTNLICDVEAKSSEVYTLSVELPDGPFDVDLESTKLILGSGITSDGGNLLDATRLVEGSQLFQTVKVDPSSAGSIFFSGVLQAGSKPTWSCQFEMPTRENTPAAPPTELAKINRIIGDNGFASFSNKQMQMNSPNPPHCPVASVESLSITAAAVNPTLNKLSINYECRRPQFSYNCGGGWAVVNNDHFTGSVIADISVFDGVLGVSNISASARTNETNCTATVVDAVSQLNGRVIE